MAKNAWYRNALDPSGGYIVQNGGAVLGDKAGAVLADPAVNGLFTGGSTMYLHEELAFTSMRKLFNVLGHELVHVSQYAAFPVCWELPAILLKSTFKFSMLPA